jgi:hypothetical protein
VIECKVVVSPFLLALYAKYCTVQH